MSITLPDNHLGTPETPTQRIGLIGDLDGNFANLMRHLNDLGVINERGEWIGGNTRLIFSGDILADRYNTGFKILLKIHELRIAAEKVGGSIDIIAGNHEGFMLAYFRGLHIKEFSSEKLPNIKPGSEHYGITELLQFGADRDKIIENMRNNPQGKIILKEMSKMKLMLYAGDALHFHTPPSINMLDILNVFCKKWDYDFNKGIYNINMLWEASLRKILFGDIFPHTSGGKTADDVYDMFHNSFLHTYNGSIDMMKRRGIDMIGQDGMSHYELIKIMENKKKFHRNIVPKTHPMYRFMLDSGIKFICYGHDSRKLTVDGIETVSLNRTNMWMNEIRDRLKDFTTQSSL